MTEDYLPTAIRSSVPPIKQTLPRSMAGVVGSASTLVDVFTLVDRVALADGTVLVTGESGNQWRFNSAHRAATGRSWGDVISR